ncbi:LacI family DNA-binding transcriptional regulator [Salinimicrobium sp. MT39]|uniref:LacI family DNA-binding transcriptional regulator n=1 Tax=Salinimicrobium profundisediminis TaxID=2994553 RepID=A0A9X3CZP1_9FLAO|nr:LacI family DNA-binding transcriptional regulator [Salinimicrobium profundisediminis]MCX2839650.1 LacI family DNA-binding transcriptional regulator [Salinimicrobium profundisediminis]
MKPKLTLKQIARELDVSVSTVSKALRDSPEISDDTRQKIQAFAKLYNYKPNNIALSLKNRRTKTIGLVLPEIVHDFFATVISGVEEVANKRGYNVLICLSNNSFDREVINLEMLANGSIDGFILSVAKETQQKGDYHHLEEVISQGMPVVMVDRVVNDIICDKVIIDDSDGARDAVQQLIDNGCRKIAIITTVDYISVGKLRTEGYLRALRNNDLEVEEDLILKIEDVENSHEEIAQFLSEREVDGIFAVNEQFATSAVKAIISQGRSVPDDVLVFSFSDGELSRRFIPTLSTVNQHGAEMGAKAADLLLDRIENDTTEEKFQTTIVKTSLIERESTQNRKMPAV